MLLKKNNVRLGLQGACTCGVALSNNEPGVHTMHTMRLGKTNDHNAAHAVAASMLSKDRSRVLCAALGT